MTDIAQGIHHAAHSAIGQVLIVEGLAIDIVGLDEVPRFPENTEFGGGVFGLLRFQTR